MISGRMLGKWVRQGKEGVLMSLLLRFVVSLETSEICRVHLRRVSQNFLRSQVSSLSLDRLGVLQKPSVRT